jgi:acetylornithine/N-succinyldiaminopimelate aminotransferase
MKELQSFPSVTAIRGRGLIIGFDLPENLASLRKDLLFKHHIFTGEAKPNTIRLLPSLALKQEEAAALIEALNIEFNLAVAQ